MYPPNPRTLAYSLAASLFLFAPAVYAQDKDKEKDKEPVVIKTVPQDAEDLRAIETQVHTVLDKVMPAVVGIQIGPGQGSGVIVSADGLVLTAGHVSGNPGSQANLVLANGKRVKGKSLGRNGGADTGMIKITDPGPYPFVEVADSNKLKVGQWCIAVGHPGGYKPNRGTVVRVGRILLNTNSFLQTDCALVGGDSGGPLFDMDGKVIAIHSRIGDRQIIQNMHVPSDAYKKDWDKLVKGENFGGNLGAPVLVQSAGGEVVREEKGKLTEKDSFDPKKPGCYHRVYTLKMVPGFAYTIDLKSPFMKSDDPTAGKRKEIDTFLRLEDAAGKQLAENDDGAGETDSRIVYRPSREQVYKIYVTTFEPHETGSYTLTIRQARIDAKDLPSGKIDVAQALKLGGAIRFLRAADVFVNAHLLDEDGKPQANQEATFTWKSGKKTLKSDDQGQIRLPLTTENLQELMLEAPDDLHALVRLTDGEGNPLNLRFGGGKRRPGN